MRLALLARCAQTHCWGQCAVHQILRLTRKEEKKTRNDTQAVAGMNSQIRISEILGFGATQRSSQGSQEGDKQARETRKKKQTPEEEVSSYRSSSVTPDS